MKAAGDAVRPPRAYSAMGMRLSIQRHREFDNTSKFEYLSLDKAKIMKED